MNALTSCEYIDNWLNNIIIIVVNVSLSKSCCIIGHRKVQVTDALVCKLESVFRDLIEKYNVYTFLFGSKSEFNSICHEVITRLKQNYPKIKRIAYTCKSESCILESEEIGLEKIYSKLIGKQEKLLKFDGEVEYKSKYTAGKLGYVERNQAMICDSDFCVFYYDANYEPKAKTCSKDMIYHKTKSGTKLAFDYAQKIKKKIINVFE